MASDSEFVASPPVAGMGVVASGRGVAPKLVVIVPVLNEAATIAEVIRRIPRTIPGIGQVEIVVIDDGSTDETAAHAREAGAVVVSHPQNRGVGAAFSTGVREALRRQADFVVNMDGDGQFNPAHIPRLIAPILEGRAGFVTCSRFAKAECMPRMSFAKRWGNAAMTRLINSICPGEDFTDVSCGFRAYTRDTLLRLNLFGRYTYTQETFLNVATQGIQIVEVPLRVRGIRRHGQSRVAGNLVRYTRKTLPIIFRTLRDLRPFLFFGSIAAVVLVLGILMGTFVFGHWVATGQTRPYQSLLLGSGVAIILGFLLFMLALLADMLNRIRRLLEEVLYLARTRHNQPPSSPPVVTPPAPQVRSAADVVGAAQEPEHTLRDAE